MLQALPDRVQVHGVLQSGRERGRRHGRPDPGGGADCGADRHRQDADTGAFPATPLTCASSSMSVNLRARLAIVTW